MQAPPGADVLVVDLDGTLLRSDLLWESFWEVLGHDWRSPAGVALALALRDGRAALKRHLTERTSLEVETLPYDPAVLDRIARWRAAGGRTALVTASDERLARQVGAHLGCFDEIHGSDGQTNLKGPEKARFLRERFGAGFTYIGDSRADLAVWQEAGAAITANASAGVRAELAQRGIAAEHLAGAAAGPRDYLRALRPHQWLKNLLVFLPLLAGHQFAMATLLQALLAFLAFSAIASSVYVLNDLLDLQADRHHPRKRERPFAAGRIPIAHGAAMTAGLLAAGTLLSVLLGPVFFGVMVLYYVMTTLYSLALKRRIVLDICVLAGLYTIRIVAGGAATGVPLSVWLLAFSIFLFFSLAAIKRQAELVDMAQRRTLKSRGRGYVATDLPFIAQAAVAAGYVSVLVMALYVSSPDVAELYPRPDLLWGICLVLLYWITRVALLTHRGEMHDDPVVFAATDRTSQLCLLAVLLLVIGGTL